MARRAAILGLAGAVVAVTPTVARADTPGRATAEADGIRADLHVEGTLARVTWRFLHPPPAPVWRIAASVDGEPVGTPPRVTPFPARAGEAAVLALVDAGGDGRAGAIEAAERSVAALSRLLPDLVPVSVAAFDGDVPPAAWQGVRPLSGGPLPAELADALRAAIERMASVPAERRGLVVFTDGFSRAPLPIEDLATAAAGRGVALFFAVAPSPRLVDLARLGRLAEMTGGAVLDADAEVARGLGDTLLSGGEVQFPLDAVVRPFWAPRATVSASVAYGTRVLDLAARVDLPAAGAGATAALVLRRAAAALPPFLAGAAVVSIALAMVRWRRRPQMGG